MQKLLLVIALVAITNRTLAQSRVENETKEIHFRIAATFKKGDSLFAYINEGTREGIEKGLLGKCINLYRAKISENYKEIATCKITKAGQALSIAYIQLYKQNSSPDSIFNGDFIALNVAIPKRETRSLLFDLASLDIYFGDMYK